MADKKTIKKTEDTGETVGDGGQTGTGIDSETGPRAADDVENEQFPAQRGNPDAEIAKRSPDRERPCDDRFRKQYVVLPAKGVPGAGLDSLTADAGLHERNQLDVLQCAIQMGVHPDGEATFDGAEPHPDGVSVILRYSCAVTPASVDTTPGDTLTPFKVLTERLDGSTDNADQKRDNRT
jgi:hypothetical protein